jgi:hypothetical protein
MSEGESDGSTDSGSDSAYEDEKMDEQELELAVLQVGADARVTGFILCQLKKSHKCEDCYKNMSTDTVQAHNFVNHQIEPCPENPKLNYPNENFNASVIRMVRYVDERLKVMGHEVDLNRKLIAMCLKNFNLNFGCELHEVELPFKIAKRATLNCLYWFGRQVRRNIKEQKKEANAKKKQQGHLVDPEENRRRNEETRRRRYSRKRSLNEIYSRLPVLATYVSKEVHSVNK